MFPVDLGIIADARSALRSLLDVYPKVVGAANGREERLVTIHKAQQQVKAELEARVKQGWDGTPINAQGYNRQQDNPNDGQARWNLISRNGQDIVSGIYLFTVDSHLGTQRGKFVVIR